MNFKKLFLSHCKIHQYEINQNQLDIINDLDKYHKENFNQNLLNKFFNRKITKLGFYLVGDVGVGKTMILNFFFDKLRGEKLRLHFNEFMIEFHDFIFKEKKNNGILAFVKNLKKKTKILYFDEFQVTNIVDAMILGRLFEKIFEENIKVLFSSNINIDELYKDGLQREQFITFIKILYKNSHEIKLSIDEDYRVNNDTIRYLFPLNQSINFKFNKFFRQSTRDKKHTTKVLEVKGRTIKIKNFYEGISRFHFDELFSENLGSEDYLKIAECCKFIFIEDLPIFSEKNSNKQQRFITFIDIIYEKKIPLMITSEIDLKDIKSCLSLKEQFKRTISRLYELTSLKYHQK